MMHRQHIATGKIITITEKYIITTEGIFNRKWYRVPGEEDYAQQEKTKTTRDGKRMV